MEAGWFPDFLENCEKDRAAVSGRAPSVWATLVGPQYQVRRRFWKPNRTGAASPNLPLHFCTAARARLAGTH